MTAAPNNGRAALNALIAAMESDAASDAISKLNAIRGNPMLSKRHLSYSTGSFANTPDYANNTAAIAAGLIVGDLYRISGTDTLAIVHS